MVSFPSSFPTAGGSAWGPNKRAAYRGGEVATAFVGPLDGMTTVVAFSMRRLYSTYEGNLLRLRRSSDDAESDFSYNANNVLDTDAITAWLGGATGHIVTRYDQSGNGRDETQASGTAQPVYTASVFGDLPAGYYGGGAKRLVSNYTWSQPVYSLMVIKMPASHSANATLWDNENTSARLIIQSDRKVIWRANTILATTTTVALEAKALVGAVANGASSSVRINGTEEASGDAGTIGGNGNQSVGARTNASEPFNGYISETIRFSSPGSLNLSSIDSEIKTYYGIS